MKNILFCTLLILLFLCPTLTNAEPTPNVFSLDKSSISIQVWKTEVLHVVGYTYVGTLAWSSSNTAVATVDDYGRVTAISTGVATITVTTRDGSMKDTCEVTVTPVTSLTIVPKTTTIAVGGTEVLLAIGITYVGTLAWSSSNTAIATVDDYGRVTAISTGTATITVATRDGKMKDTCEVTVINTDIILLLNKSSTSIQTGGTEQLVVTLVPPVDIFVPLTWSSSNIDITTVSASGLVNGISVGTATVTVNTEYGKYPATCVVTVLDKHDTKRAEEHSGKSGGGCNALKYVMLGFLLIFVLLQNTKNKSK